MQIIDKKWQRAFFKGLSAISGNLSAGYIGIIIIMPALNRLTVSIDYLLLIFNSMMGILLLVLTIYFERRSI